ncbi:MAG: flagellar motor switch protein FliN [Planctomycetota bacterium]
MAKDTHSAAPPARPTAPPEAQGDGEFALNQSEIEALIGNAPSTEQAGAAHAQPAAPAAAPGQQRPASDVELLLDKAEAAIASIDGGPGELPPGVSPFELSDFSGTPPNREAATLELVRDVQLDLRIELGRTRMHLEDVLRLRQGAVVPLDKLAGDPVDIYVNGRLIARGEVLVLNDNFCVRVTELVAGESAVA